MANNIKRYCTVQVDLDGLWVIGKLIGRDFPLEPDPLFEEGTLRLLSLFDRFGVKATFFAVARDLESVAKRRMLQEIVARGHEIASHGLLHRYLTTASDAEVASEIRESKRALEGALKVPVYGFKAPGFTAHRRMVHMLEDAGYVYDSSVFPTSFGLCMEMVSKLAYSKWDMFTAPSSPYRPSIENIFKRGKSSIIELPVATLPFFRTPMHFSYAILGGASYAAISRKFLQWSSRQYANFLFHPLDLVDRDIIKTDAKVYGLDIPDDVKLSLADEMLSFFKDSYDLVTSHQMSVIMNSKI